MPNLFRHLYFKTLKEVQGDRFDPGIQNDINDNSARPRITRSQDAFYERNLWIVFSAFSANSAVKISFK